MAKPQHQGEPRYQVPRELADSLAFRSLPGASKLLWHDMMSEYRGRNNGNISAALSVLALRGWRSPATLTKALLHLMAYGFIRETRKGGKAACNLKQCCLYAFTHLPVNANDQLGIKGAPATFDYRNFDPSSNPVEPTLSLQKMKRHATESESTRFNNCSLGRSIATENEARQIA